MITYISIFALGLVLSLAIAPDAAFAMDEASTQDSETPSLYRGSGR